MWQDNKNILTHDKENKWSLKKKGIKVKASKYGLEEDVKSRLWSESVSLPDSHSSGTVPSSAAKLSFLVLWRCNNNTMKVKKKKKKNTEISHPVS